MKIKVLISSIPYVYFIGWAAYWFVMDISVAGTFNFIALTILIAVTVQAIVKNNAVGLSLGALSMIMTVYMFFAVLSEFNDFSVVNDSARLLMLVGTLISISGFVMALFIFKSHLRRIGFKLFK